MLHARIHPLALGPVMRIPFVAATADVVVVTLLFASRRTAKAAYLLNGLFVIYGSTIMTHFAVAMHQPGAGIWASLLGSTFASSAILFADFMIGKTLFDGYWAEARADVRPWNFLAPGWWLAHFTVIPAVYTAGHAFWR